MSGKKSYYEKLKDPRWQKIRLKVLERDEFTCQICGDTENTLHVHHRFYKRNCDPWDYELDDLVTLCEDCHGYETDNMSGAEHDLILVLKSKGFLSDDFYNIFSGILNLKMKYPPDVMSNYIKDLLTIEITDEYFKITKGVKK